VAHDAPRLGSSRSQIPSSPPSAGLRTDLHVRAF